MNRVKKGLDNQAIGFIAVVVVHVFGQLFFLFIILYNWGYFLFCLYFFVSSVEQG